MSFQTMSGFTRLLLVTGIVTSGAATLCAQYSGPAVSSPAKPASAPAAAMSAGHGDERILPGDVIAISILGAPEFTLTGQVSAGTISGGSSGSATGLKIGADGEVVLPYLGTVKLAGMTTSQVAGYLAKALKDGGILVDPQVSVQLLDSPTRVITVIGELVRPSPVPAYGQLRLLDVISACGGFTPLASHTVTIRRPGGPDPIIVELGSDPKAASDGNISLIAGDTVIVPKVGSVFVVGQVKTQGAIPLGGNAPITVMRAVALAGGVNYGAALSKARIIRTTADNQHIEIMLDMKKIMYGKQQDIALASDDILFIPTNLSKAALAAGGAATVTALLYGATNTYSVAK